MRLFNVLVAAMVFASSIALTGNTTSAAAFPNFTMVHCPHFAATVWVSRSHTTGNRYGIVLFNGKIKSKVTCSQAIAWAKKLMGSGTQSGAVLPIEVQGGPAGYHCYLTPDGAGHAFGGTCQIRDASRSLLTSFDWLALIR